MKYKTTANSLYACQYHFVWCPKYRRKVLVDEVASRLKELICEKCSILNVDIIEMEIMPDHVHLLLSVPPQYSPRFVISQLKGFSSSALRKEYKSLTTRLPCLWTSSYFVSTVGGAPLEGVKQYILSQKTSQRQ